MNSPFNFEYYISQGIVKKSTFGSSRAEFLINETKKSLIGLNRVIKKIGIDEFNTNSIIKDIQDIILEMIRAKMLIDGFSASGNNAHEAEVAYMKILGFSDADISEVNELRKARNSITYYGKIYEVEYAKKVYVLLKSIYPKLEEVCKIK
jgi:hypothetical protein